MVVLSAAPCGPCPGLSVGQPSSCDCSEGSSEVRWNGHHLSAKALLGLIPARTRFVHFVPLTLLRVDVCDGPLSHKVFLYVVKKILMGSMLCILQSIVLISWVIFQFLVCK